MRDWISEHRNKVAVRELATCREQGRKVAANGGSLNDNPYRPSEKQPAGYRHDLIEAWDAGFNSMHG